MRVPPRLLCVGSLLLVAACRTYLPYAAKPLTSPAEARRVIQQTLEEQRDEHAPVSVDVTDERFRVVQTRETDAEDSGMFGVAVYYSRIGRVELSRKKGVYAVSIFAADGALLMHVFTYDQVSAERFIDALATMRAAAS
jgi:hypothetical protein